MSKIDTAKLIERLERAKPTQSTPINDRYAAWINAVIELIRKMEEEDK